MYMRIRSRMSSIMGKIEAEHPELFALEFWRGPVWLSGKVFGS